jgi:Ca2+-binding EF-hand superfamily protein
LLTPAEPPKNLVWSSRLQATTRIIGALLMSSLAVQAAEVTFATGGYARGGQGMRTMKMMTAMDTNKDHMLSKEEFMKYNEKLFGMMDKNKDGMISVDEWLEKQRKATDG